MSALRYWFIVKNTRYTTHPYMGPTCEAAGVEPGKIYASREEAERDAVKLSEANPVGFYVAQVVFPVGVEAGAA